jgi:hypothetical protein
MAAATASSRPAHGDLQHNVTEQPLPFFNNKL